MFSFSPTAERPDALPLTAGAHLRRAGNVESLGLRAESRGECGRLF
jgi:hypothetical protein